jgi:hypothetical protein
LTQQNIVEIINNMNTITTATAIAVKAKTTAETRRFRLDTVSFAALQSTLLAVGLLTPASAKIATLSWTDADGDSITFSSDRELQDAVQGLAPDAVFNIFVHLPNSTESAPTSAPIAGSAPILPAQIKTPASAAPAPAPAPVVSVPTDEELWLNAPAWLRANWTSKFAPGTNADTFAAFQAMPEHAQARARARCAQVAAKFAAKAEKKGDKFAAKTADDRTTPTPTPTPSASSDEELWLNAPLWFRKRCVAKFVPEQNADSFLAFQALPQHVQLRVRARCLQHAAKNAAKIAPAESDAADRAMWAQLPDWVRLKVSSKAARHGHAINDPHSFAVFENLPKWRQEKIRNKCRSHAHKLAKVQQKFFWAPVAAPAPTHD